MSSKKGAMKKKLENMHLGERINYGYRMVITMMLISGLLSIAVIGVVALSPFPVNGDFVIFPIKQDLHVSYDS